MKAVLRKIRISPKKANLIAGMVRGKKVNESLDLLKFTPKKGAKILYKVVQSAASNAKNNFNQSLDDLVITKILVTKGPTYKRSLPISRGRTHPIRKRTSHITVEVGIMEGAEKPVKKAMPTGRQAEKEIKPKAEKKALATSKDSGSATKKIEAKKEVKEKVTKKKITNKKE